MYDFHEADKPLSGGEFLTGLVVGIILLGLFGAEIFYNYEPAKLSVLFILLFWGPLVLFHELGHAIMARILGLKVSAIVVGFGRPLLSFRWSGTDILLRALPVEGFTLTESSRGTNSRYKNALVYFAGPGVELLLAILILQGSGWGFYSGAETSISLIALRSLAGAALIGAVINLIPQGALRFNRQGEATLFPNDGLGIYYSLAGKFDDVD